MPLTIASTDVMLMRDTRRALWLLITTSVHASPGRAALAGLEVVGAVMGVLKAWWLGLVVDGALRHVSQQVLVGVIALVVTVGCEWGLGMIGAEARMTLAEKVGFAFDRILARLTSSIPSIEHLERSDYLNQIEVLRQKRAVLGEGLASLLWSVNVFAMAIAAIAMAVAIDPKLLVLLLTAAPAIIGSRLRYRWNAKAEDDASIPGRQARHLAAVASDAQAGMEIRIFGLQAEITRRLAQVTKRWQQPSVWAARRTNAVSLVEEAFFVLTVGAVLLWLVTAPTGHGSTTSIVVAVVAARQIQDAVTNVVYRAGGIADTLRNVRRVLWLTDYAHTEHARYAGTSPAPTTLTHGIDLKHVAFTYHEAKTASLNDVTVHLPAGSVVALVGENGAGKSSLVKLLTGLYRPTNGQILIDGVDLADIDIDGWRRHTSAAFQDFVRLEFTAQHAIGLGDTDHADDANAASRALEDAAAGDLTGALPDGLNTQLGTHWDRGVDLSGGQWQKLALARSMMRADPLLLIFDEPTAALDAQTEHDLFERYAAAARQASATGAITVLVTHRFSTVRDADLVLVLDHGHLVEHGTHQQLLNNNGPYAELYTLQAVGYQ